MMVMEPLLMIAVFKMAKSRASFL